MAWSVEWHSNGYGIQHIDLPDHVTLDDYYRPIDHSYRIRLAHYKVWRRRDDGGRDFVRRFDTADEAKAYIEERVSA